MPIHTPIIIKSGSIEVLSTTALKFTKQGSRWVAKLGLTQASIQLAVLHTGNNLEFFPDTTMGDRLLRIEAPGGDRVCELDIRSSGSTVSFSTDPRGRGRVGKRHQYKVMTNINNGTLTLEGCVPPVRVDHVKDVVAIVDTELFSLRRGATVGTGATFAAIGFVAGLAAGAFLAGGLDDGGW